VFADTLLRAEQQHLLQLLLWAAVSIVAGTAIVVILSARRIQSSLLTHFALQTIGWGIVFGIIAAIQWKGAKLRDLAGAARLERLLWLNIGLDAGYVLTGTAIAASGWILAKRLGAVGAGIAIIIQGLALLVIDLQLAAVVSK
jgi:hypothetical protein